ncbi:hypothetical protein M0R45_019328 [Rubus argutus]|uniref:Secreted protein n=1 Tax=Rubus argutus TaxID=59490 RepID=A0AAW1X534_RUBAR
MPRSRRSVHTSPAIAAISSVSLSPSPSSFATAKPTISSHTIDDASATVSSSTVFSLLSPDHRTAGVLRRCAPPPSFADYPRHRRSAKPKSDAPSSASHHHSSHCAALFRPNHSRRCDC